MHFFPLSSFSHKAFLPRLLFSMILGNGLCPTQAFYQFVGEMTQDIGHYRPGKVGLAKVGPIVTGQFDVCSHTLHTSTGPKGVTQYGIQASVAVTPFRASAETMELFSWVSNRLAHEVTAVIQRKTPGDRLQSLGIIGFGIDTFEWTKTPWRCWQGLHLAFHRAQMAQPFLEFILRTHRLIKGLRSSTAVCHSDREGLIMGLTGQLCQSLQARLEVSFYNLSAAQAQNACLPGGGYGAWNVQLCWSYRPIGQIRAVLAYEAGQYHLKLRGLLKKSTKTFGKRGYQPLYRELMAFRTMVCPTKERLKNASVEPLLHLLRYRSGVTPAALSRDPWIMRVISGVKPYAQCMADNKSIVRDIENKNLNPRGLSDLVCASLMQRSIPTPTELVSGFSVFSEFAQKQAKLRATAHMHSKVEEVSPHALADLREGYWQVLVQSLCNTTGRDDRCNVFMTLCGKLSIFEDTALPYLQAVVRWRKALATHSKGHPILNASLLSTISSCLEGAFIQDLYQLAKGEEGRQVLQRTTLTNDLDHSLSAILKTFHAYCDATQAITRLPMHESVLGVFRQALQNRLKAVSVSMRGQPIPGSSHHFGQIAMVKQRWMDEVQIHHLLLQSLIEEIGRHADPLSSIARDRMTRWIDRVTPVNFLALPKGLERLPLYHRLAWRSLQTSDALLPSYKPFCTVNVGQWLLPRDETASTRLPWNALVRVTERLSWITQLHRKGGLYIASDALDILLRESSMQACSEYEAALLLVEANRVRLIPDTLAEYLDRDYPAASDAPDPLLQTLYARLKQWLLAYPLDPDCLVQALLGKAVPGIFRDIRDCLSGENLQAAFKVWDKRLQRGAKDAAGIPSVDQRAWREVIDRYGCLTTWPAQPPTAGFRPKNSAKHLYLQLKTVQERLHLHKGFWEALETMTLPERGKTKALLDGLELIYSDAFLEVAGIPTSTMPVRKRVAPSAITLWSQMAQRAMDWYADRTHGFKLLERLVTLQCVPAHGPQRVPLVTVDTQTLLKHAQAWGQGPPRLGSDYLMVVTKYLKSQVNWQKAHGIPGMSERVLHFFSVNPDRELSRPIMEKLAWSLIRAWMVDGQNPFQSLPESLYGQAERQQLLYDLFLSDRSMPEMSQGGEATALQRQLQRALCEKLGALNAYTWFNPGTTPAFVGDLHDYLGRVWDGLQARNTALLGALKAFFYLSGQDEESDRGLLSWVYHVDEIPPSTTLNRLDDAVRMHIQGLIHADSLTVPWTTLVDALEPKLNVILVGPLAQQQEIRLELKFVIPVETELRDRLETLLEGGDLKVSPIELEPDFALAFEEIHQQLVRDERNFLRIMGASLGDPLSDRSAMVSSTSVLQPSDNAIAKLRKRLANLAVQARLANDHFDISIASALFPPDWRSRIQTFKRLVENIASVTEVWRKEIEDPIACSDTLDRWLARFNEPDGSMILQPLVAAVTVCQKFYTHAFRAMQVQAKQWRHLQRMDQKKISAIAQKKKVKTFYATKEAWENRMEQLACQKEKLRQFHPEQCAAYCLHFSKFFEYWIAQPEQGSDSRTDDSRCDPMDDILHPCCGDIDQIKGALEKAIDPRFGFETGWSLIPILTVTRFAQTLWNQQMAIENGLKSAVISPTGGRIPPSPWRNHRSSHRDKALAHLLALREQCETFAYQFHLRMQIPQCSDAKIKAIHICRSRIAQTKVRAESLMAFTVCTTMTTFEWQRDKRLTRLMQGEIFGVDEDWTEEWVGKSFARSHYGMLEPRLEASRSRVAQLGRQLQAILASVENRARSSSDNPLPQSELCEQVEKLLETREDLRAIIHEQMVLLQFDPYDHMTSGHDWSPQARALFQGLWVEISNLYGVMARVVGRREDQDEAQPLACLYDQFCAAIVDEQQKAPSAAQAHYRRTQFLKEGSNTQGWVGQTEQGTLQTLEPAMAALECITQRQEQLIEMDDQIAVAKRILDRAVAGFRRLQSALEVVQLYGSCREAGNA